jgi:hemerythrin-like domain-containing protein
VTAAEGAPVPEDRVVLAGKVNFTIMYAAHDAFTRDLRRLTNACTTGRAFTPDTAATWARFKTQLQIHHRAEDVALWPQLRDAVSAPEALMVLEAMQAEHARLDPVLDAVDAAFAADHQAGLAESIEQLSAGLATHMRHEENAALPLVEAHIGTTGWAAFTRHIRRTQGLRGGAVFFPWLLDDAPTTTRDRVLNLLPPPVRLLCRRVWAPRYRRAQLSLRGPAAAQ